MKSQRDVTAWIIFALLAITVGGAMPTLTASAAPVIVADADDTADDLDSKASDLEDEAQRLRDLDAPNSLDLDSKASEMEDKAQKMRDEADRLRDLK